MSHSEFSKTEVMSKHESLKNACVQLNEGDQEDKWFWKWSSAVSVQAKIIVADVNTIK